MKHAIRLGAAIALPCLFAACAANPEHGPGQRAPNRAEVAQHNATAPEQMQIVCRDFADSSSLIKRRTCWLRQDMDLQVAQRKTVLAPARP